jgi:hypothetical protein
MGIADVIASLLDPSADQSGISNQESAIMWAHQDSNLGQAGYEPAALTAELWARTLG